MRAYDVQPRRFDCQLGGVAREVLATFVPPGVETDLHSALKHS